MVISDFNCKNCNCIDIILSVGQEIISQYDIEKIIHTCYNQINTIINVPLLAIGIFDSGKNILQFYGKNDLDSEIKTGMLEIENNTIWSVRCFQNSEEIIFNSHKDDETMKFSKVLFNVKDARRKSFIYIPLLSKSKKIGVITFQSFTKNAFKSYHINILRSIANYVSVAIENAQYFNKIEMQNIEMQSIIENMEDIIDARTAEIELQKITLEKQAVQLQSANKELEILSIVAKKTENAIMIMDNKGNIIWINDYFTKIYKYNLTNFLRVRGKNIKQTSFNPNIVTDFNECIKTKKAVYYEALNIKENGESIWTQTSLTPIVNDSNEITHLVTIDSDITKIKHAEQSILEKSQQIQSSIEYASKIQRAAFPSIDSINKILPNNFIFWKPLNIVSGDFYWIKKKHQYTFIVMGDCTGHGVPGALLTMLGCSLMEQIITNYIHETSAEVLSKLNILFEQRFRHWVMGTEVFDGMDVAICIFDSNQNIVQFSGANQDLLCVYSNGYTQYKGNRTCIGCTDKNEICFDTYTIPIIPNQTLYLFSDGFSSQFGGPDGKKYMKRKLIDFLNSLKNISVQNQKKLLSQEFESWKGTEYQQTDDILIVGFSL